MKILAIIPARGGSKGIINKNIIDLNSKPLIHYTLSEVLKVKEISRIIVSTESEKIKSVCDRLGDFVPFMRPKELAQDHSRTIDLVKDVLRRLKEVYNEEYDYICLLQPTSPLRIAKDIEESIGLMKEQMCGSVISLVKIDEPHPYKMKVLVDGQIEPLLANTDSSIPRQELPEVYELNGAIYISEIKGLIETQNFFSKPSIPYIMPMERSVNINNHFDLRQAEFLLNEKIKK